MQVKEVSFVWRGVVKINRILMKEPSVMDSRLKKYELFKMNTHSNNDASRCLYEAIAIVVSNVLLCFCFSNLRKTSAKHNTSHIRYVL